MMHKTIFDLLHRIYGSEPGAYDYGSVRLYSTNHYNGPFLRIRISILEKYDLLHYVYKHNSVLITDIPDSKLLEIKLLLT